MYYYYYLDSAAAAVILKLFSLLLLLLLQFSHVSEGQQAYVNNGQLDCYKHYNYTDGFVCNGPSSSCLSYLTFRSNPPNYDSAITIGYLLGAEASQIATINNVTDVEKIPKDTILIVPVNCSCSGYYQHNASYSLKAADETYFIVANNTYQGLTTCQAMMASNPSYDSRNLSAGLDLVVPLMCACPTSNQTSAAYPYGAVKYLLTYLVTWYDSISSIADLFGVLDQQSILDANQLSSDSLIYPFTPLLVPLHSVPTKIQIVVSPAPSPPAETPIVPAAESNSSKKWVFIGVGIGAALLVLTISGILFFFCRRRRRSQKEKPISDSGVKKKFAAQPRDDYGAVPPHDNNSWSISSEGIRYAIESLTVYRFEELEMATGSFSKSNRIKGSVYRGTFKGDSAAVKMMKGDVSSEINILKKINHGNIIRLSGICVHQGNTYLVYEYAENGSLSDWLHPDDKYKKLHQSDDHLGWKQRVQIGYDVADALNYIHNYSNPPYVHKNLKSSNILLDSNMRAKVANFGVARSMDQEEDEAGGMQLTRHVVGTQGYMAPEYIENGVITPKLDVFAFGVLILELLSGREAASDSKNGGGGGGGGGEELLSASIKVVLQGENVREKLVRLMDPGMRQEYPLDLAFSLAQLANNCVSRDLNSRPAMSEVHMTLSKILSSSLDWDPSDELEHSRSLSHGR